MTHNYTFGYSNVSKENWNRAFGKSDTVALRLKDCVKAYLDLNKGNISGVVNLFGCPVFVSDDVPDGEMFIIKDSEIYVRAINIK